MTRTTLEAPPGWASTPELYLLAALAVALIGCAYTMEITWRVEQRTWVPVTVGVSVTVLAMGVMLAACGFALSARSDVVDRNTERVKDVVGSSVSRSAVSALMRDPGERVYLGTRVLDGKAERTYVMVTDDGLVTTKDDGTILAGGDATP